MMFGTPYWLRLLGGPGLMWEMPAGDKAIYLTFDDGPTPGTTPRILDLLQEADVGATFFCVGANVEKYPETYRQILQAGHATGNHGHNHLKGWKTDTATYIENTNRCRQLVDSRLFRPPYGKITHAQRRALLNNYDIIMWTVLSRDYDPQVSRERCLSQSWKYTRPGSIIVFHDHLKALDKVEYVLPRYIEMAREQGYDFKVLSFEG